MRKHPVRHAFVALLAVAAGAMVLPAGGQPKSEPKPIVTAQTDVPGIVAEVMEATRKEGVLTLRVRLRNVGDKPAKFTMVGYSRYDDIYLSAATVKYVVIRDARKNPVATPLDGGGHIDVRVAPGKSWSWWGKFPAPPAGQKTVALYWKIGAPVEDIPILDRP